MATPAPKRQRLSFVNAATATQMLLDDLDDSIPVGSDDENLSDSDNDDEFVPEMERSDDHGQDDAHTLATDQGSSSASTSCQGQDITDSQHRTWHWVKKDLPPHASPENTLAPRGPAIGATTPLKMFSAFFDEEIVEKLCMETNRQRLVLNRLKVNSVSCDELLKFVGICLYMTIVDLPFRRMYWCPRTKQSIVSEAMTTNRFEEIFSLLHCNDNETEKKIGQPGYDRLHKVRPLLTALNAKFDACAEKETHVSVDEQIIPFKGRHSLKVYMMKKPKKWGYKVWVMAGRSGYVHKFRFAGDNIPDVAYDDISKLIKNHNIGKSGEVVMTLLHDQPNNTYAYFDNYFSSPDLLALMKEKNIYGTCTMRPIRSRNCPLLCDKDLKKNGRGKFDYRTDKDSSILLCEWYDNKVVMVASNVHSVEPTHNVKRYDGKKKEHIQVKCPGLIKEYNQSMGGVDKCDMLLSLYRNDLKSKKWYKRMVFHLIDLCVVNAWLLYKVAKGDECTIPLCHFKLDVAMGLILSKKVNTPVPRQIESNPVLSLSAKDVNLDARFDRIDHFPKKMDIKNGQRCKMPNCNRKSLVMCRKCSVYLCTTAKDFDDDCFYLFHH